MSSHEPRAFEPATARLASRSASLVLPDWAGTAFTAQDGRKIKAAFHLERVFSLRSFAGAAMRIEPVLHVTAGAPIEPDWRGRLGYADVVKVDEAASAVLAALRTAMDAEKLITPVSLETLVGPFGGQERAQRLFRGEGAPPIVEILTVSQGAPCERLAEGAAMLSPWVKGIIARIDPARPRLEGPGAAGLVGLSMDCSGFSDEGLLLGALWSLARSAKTWGLRTLALGLPRETGLDLAASVAITHASLRQDQDAPGPAAKRTALETSAA